MIKWVLGILVSSILFLAVYLYAYLGYSRPVALGEEDREELHLIYKSHRGAYHQIGPTLREVEAWAAENRVPCPRTFAEFLDDPNAVDQDRLRSHVGCVTLVKPELSLPDGFVYEAKPARRYVVARFDGAPSIGPLKVYPKVVEYFDKQRMKMPVSNLEIYLQDGRTFVTEFLFVIR